MRAPVDLRATVAIAAPPTIIFSEGYRGIERYDAQGDPLGNILGPNANLETIDGDSNLWVSDSKYRISEYAPPYVVPRRSLTDADGVPVTIAVDSHSGPLEGFMAVINFPTVYGFESISFYRPNETRPCKTLTVRERAGFINAEFDGAGKLYLSGYTPRSSRMVLGVVANDCNATAVEPITIARNVYYPAGLQIGPDGNFAVIGLTYGNGVTATLYTYHHPVGNNLGPPITSTVLGPAGTEPLNFALSRGAHTYWTSNFSPNTITEYAYPNGSTPLVTIYEFDYSFILVAPPYVP